MIVNQGNIALQQFCGEEFCELELESLSNVKIDFIKLKK